MVDSVSKLGIRQGQVLCPRISRILLDRDDAWHVIPLVCRCRLAGRPGAPPEEGNGGKSQKTDALEHVPFRLLSAFCGPHWDMPMARQISCRPTISLLLVPRASLV